ncbi:MAG TPA: prepilin peptidase, partial [Candidatus Eisenbacteria bacterium]
MSPLLIVVGLFGALVGSFLNVVIHRLPIHESIVFPPSRCPKCGAGI